MTHPGIYPHAIYTRTKQPCIYPLDTYPKDMHTWTRSPGHNNYSSVQETIDQAVCVMGYRIMAVYVYVCVLGFAIDL